MNSLCKVLTVALTAIGACGDFPLVQKQVAVIPRRSELFAGEVQQFRARLAAPVDSDRVKWTATGGTISNHGVFTASGSAGRFVVVATARDASDTAVVLVAPGRRKVYEAQFLTPEQQLSEGGRWVHTDTLLTTCQTVNGRAFGTQSGRNGYDDSNAYVTGFGDDYEIEGVVWINPRLSGPGNREVELLLRWSDDGPIRSTSFGPTHANGYEINAQHAGAYMQLGRFKGALLKQVDNYAVPRAGDRFRARIEGQRVRVWWNDVLKIDFTDSSPRLQLSSGNPGIGFYVSGGAPNTDFGFESVRVTNLPPVR